MRKLIVSMNISLDGLIAGPGNELDWHFSCWTSEMAELICEQLSKADTILLGKNTYRAMAAYWPTVSSAVSLSRDDIAYATLMNNYTKVVFSETISTLPWGNSRAIRGNLRQQVIKLKKEAGKDIIIYGSGELVSALLSLGLIDEYLLWVHPVILGKGKRLFGQTLHRAGIELRKMQKFSSDVILLDYKVLR